MHASIKNKIKLSNLFRIYATFSVAFLLAYIISGIVSPTSNSSAIDCVNGMVSDTNDICSTDSTDINVSITGAWTVAVSSSGTLNVDVTPKGSGTTSTATDNVNIYTNTPNGYQLYLNSTSGSTDIYNNTDTQQELNHFVATTGTKDSPIALSSNSWGYSLATNPTTFSKVETSSSTADSLIRTTTTKTSGSGDNLDVTYGFNADTKLTPGTYTTSVTYTAVAEVPSYNITSISPNELHINDQTDKQITIMTSAPSSELGLGNITAKIGTVDLTNCSEIIINGYRGATCIYTGNLPVGAYNVQLTSSWHSATYTLNNAFTIYKTVQDITTMQEMTSDICNRMSDNQTATLQDPRGSYNTTTPANYGIVKALDGNCWMRDNLNLYNRQISDADSDLPVNTTITLPDTSNWNTDIYNDMKIHRATNSGYADQVYYNWCAAVGLTSTCNTTEQQNQSICPKNWQLPVSGGVGTAINKSFAKLLNSYEITTSNQLVTDDSTKSSYILGFRKYYGDWLASYNSEWGQGSRGQFITSTPYSNDIAYTMTYWTAYDYAIDPNKNTYVGKGNGYTLRCVVR